MIVDVDTHWEATSYAQRRVPARALARPAAGQPRHARVRRSPVTCSARSRPTDRPSAMELLPNLVRMAEERGGPVILHPLHDSSPAERVALDGPHRHRPLPGQPGRLLAAARVPRRRPRRRASAGATTSSVSSSRPSPTGSTRSRSSTSPTSTSPSTELERARGARRPRVLPLHRRRPPVRRRVARATRRGIRCGRPPRASAWSRSSTSATPSPTSPAGPTSVGTCPAAPAIGRR